MDKYHIVFKENPDDYISKGITLEALSPAEAVLEFQEKYPTATFVGMYNLETVSKLLNHQVEMAAKFNNNELIHETQSRIQQEKEKVQESIKESD